VGIRSSFGQACGRSLFQLLSSGMDSSSLAIMKSNKCSNSQSTYSGSGRADHRRRFCEPEFGAQQFIFGIQQVQNGVEEKGQQIEGQQEGCQMLVSMPKLCSKVVAFGFEDIVVLILHFPAVRPACTISLTFVRVISCRVAQAFRKVGFAGGLVLDGHFAPIHLQGVCSCS